MYVHRLAAPCEIFEFRVFHHANLVEYHRVEQLNPLSDWIGNRRV